MNIIYIIFLITNLITKLTSIYLNNYQINLINKLIRDQKLSNNQRIIINNILFDAYYNWSIKKAIEFKSIHKYKCSNIKNEELIFYSQIGLYKSIHKYNGKFNFINYSSIYIKSELLKLLTDKYSLSLIPKKNRMNSKYNLSSIELKKYKYLLNINLFSKFEPFHLELFMNNKDEDILGKLSKKYEFEENINNLFINIPPLTKKIIYLKYFNDKKYTNKQLSELMCCSEETIRQKLNLIKENKF